MNSNDSPNLFGVYNARHLDPREVASTFVPQKKFWDLLGTSNNLLIGPRGSGKTTLLKMLQPAAISAWKHERAPEAHSRLGFVGVFVPTDLNWSEEINVAVECLPTEERDTLTEALFVANVQLALISSLSQLAVDEVTASLAECYRPISRDQESEIVSCFEKIWKFREDNLFVPSFRSFRRTLRSRITVLSSFRPNLPDKEQHIENIRQTLLASQFNFEATFLEAIEVIRDVTGVRRRWGLLFDEVELANSFLQRAVFSRLRSANSEDVVYKLAVVPYVPAANILNKVNKPGVSNDWTPITLWYTDQAEATRFCRDLWDQVSIPYKLGSLDPQSIFGSNNDDDRSQRSMPGGRRLRYGSQSDRQREFLSLYSKDQYFRLYMKDHGIVPERLDQLPARAMDSVIRKIAPLVAYRDQFIKVSANDKVKLRSVKSNARLYSGWEAICWVSEGNPRWFKSIIDVLLREWQSNKKTLSRSTQSIELERASRRFKALVAVCPVGEMDPAETEHDVVGPLQFVEAIAKFQRDYLLDKNFRADMPLSIECDAESDPALLVFLSACLNIGAIISADEEDAALSLAALRGRKFRLSFLLAPSMLLPLRTGTPRALSTIFSRAATNRLRRQLQRAVNIPIQRTLWEP